MILIKSILSNFLYLIGNIKTKMLDHKLLPNSFINNKSGIYIISYLVSPDTPRNKKVLVKIGKAYNLKNRIDSYHTCFVDSFYTWSVILTSKRNYSALEQIIHNTLKKYLYKDQVYDARRKGEWYSLRKDTLEKTISGILKRYNVRGGIQNTIYNVHPEYFKIRKD